MLVEGQWTLYFIVMTQKLFFRDKSLEKTLHFALDQFKSSVFSCEIPDYLPCKAFDGV